MPLTEKKTDLMKFRDGEEFDAIQAMVQEIEIITSLEEALENAKAELKVLATAVE